MKLKTEAKDLAVMCKVLAGVTETKTTIPILSCVLLDGENQRAVATDLEATVSVPLPGKLEKGKSKEPVTKLCVSLKKVQQLAGALEGEVTLTALENHWVSIANGKARAKVVGLAPENFPVQNDIAGRNAEIDREEFQRAIERVAFAISTEESRYTLNGALLEIEKGAFRLVATNGHHLSLASGKAAGDAIRVLIPRRALALLQRLESDAAVVKITVGETEAKFTVGECVIATRLLSGQFPNYENVLPKQSTTQAVLAAEEFNAAQKKILPLADSRSYATKLEIEAERIVLKTQSAEYGEGESWLAAKVTGPALVIGVNASLLAGFMGQAEGEVSIGLTDDQSAIDFRSGDNWRYVLMPLRV